MPSTNESTLITHSKDSGSNSDNLNFSESSSDHDGDGATSAKKASVSTKQREQCKLYLGEVAQNFTSELAQLYADMGLINEETQNAEFDINALEDSKAKRLVDFVKRKMKDIIASENSNAKTMNVGDLVWCAADDIDETDNTDDTADVFQSFQSNIVQSSRTLPTFFCHNADCRALQIRDVPMFLETSFVSLSLSGKTRSHWVCHSCGFRSCGACMEAITVQNATCPLVRRFPDADTCVHVAMLSSRSSLSSSLSPKIQNETGKWLDFSPSSNKSNQNLKAELLLTKWTALTPRQNMSPYPGLARSAVVGATSTLDPINEAQLFGLERLHRIHVNTVSQIHPDRDKRFSVLLDKLWIGADDRVKEIYKRRCLALKTESSLNLKESVELTNQIKEGAKWRSNDSSRGGSYRSSSLSSTRASTSAMKMFIQENLKQLRQDEQKRGSALVVKSAKQASLYIAGIWDNYTAKEKAVYEQKSKEEARIRVEEKNMTPKEQDCMLVQVEVLCNLCGNSPQGDAAVMPISFQFQANDPAAMISPIPSQEHLALLCHSCQEHIDNSMASISMAPPPRVQVCNSELSNIAPLQHTTQTAQLFTSLLSEDRNGMGNGPNACLYRSLNPEKKATKFKLDYQKYTNMPGNISLGIPLRLLPNLFSARRKPKYEKKFNTNINIGLETKSKNDATFQNDVHATPLASEFSLRADRHGLAFDAAVQSCQNYVVPETNGQYYGSISKINAMLQCVTDSVPRAVLKDVVTQPDIVSSSIATFEVQDIKSLIFSVRVIHRFPRYLCDLNTTIEKVEALGMSSATALLEKTIDPRLTDEHILDLVAGAGINAATTDAINELKKTATCCLSRLTTMWKEELVARSSYSYYSSIDISAQEDSWPCLALCGQTDAMSRLLHIRQGSKLVGGTRSGLFAAYGSPNEFQSLGAWLEGCGRGFSQYSRKIINSNFMKSSGEILPSEMAVEEQMFLHKSLRCLRVADEVLTAAYHKAEDIRAGQRRQSTRDDKNPLIGSADWWPTLNLVEKKEEDDLRVRFIADRKNTELGQPDLLLVDVFCCFSSQNSNTPQIRSASSKEMLSNKSPAGLADIRTAIPQDLYDKIKLSEIGIMGFVKRSWGTTRFAVIPSELVKDNLIVETYQTHSSSNSPSRLIATHLLQDRVTNSAKSFAKNWLTLTQGVFKQVNWDNLFVAGGAVLRCLIGTNDCMTSAHVAAAQGWGTSSDIDIFVYGLEEQHATTKAQEVLAAIAKQAETQGDVFQTDHSVTLFGVDGAHPAIQIVLRCYKSPTEVLCGFDIDACCVGFDGKRVLALPRCVRALRSRTMLVDLDRRSLTYEKRLLKYSQRGFLIACGGFREADFDRGHFAKQPRWICKGLAKLLTRAVSPRFSYFSIFDISTFQEELRDQAKGGSQYLGSGNYGDYGFVPYWGGFVTQAAIDELKKEGTKDFPLKDGSFAHLANVCKDVVLDLKWVTQAPGRQIMTGSFHPISGGDWSEQHRWNRNHLPPPEDAEDDKSGPKQAHSNQKSSLTSLFNRRRFFHSYLLSVRARSIINAVLLPAPNSFAAEAILPYLLAEDIGRFAMTTTSGGHSAIFPGQDVASLIQSRVEMGHHDSVNPVLIGHLERNSVSAVIAGHTNPVHNPVLSSLTRLFADVIRCKLAPPKALSKSTSIRKVSVDSISTSTKIENNPDTVFPSDTKSLLVGIVDELMFQSSLASRTSYSRIKRRHLSASSSFISKFLESSHSYSYSASDELKLLPAGCKWHPMVLEKMSSLYSFASKPKWRSAAAKLERPLSGKHLSSHRFEFSEHLVRIFFQQSGAIREQLSSGDMQEVFEDIVGSGEPSAFIPGLGGIERRKIIAYTYMVEKILRQLLHIVMDNIIDKDSLSQELPVIKPANVFRALSSDRLLWCLFSQCVFPSTGMLPSGLRSDCLQRSRRVLSEGIEDMAAWNHQRKTRIEEVSFQHKHITDLRRKIEHELKYGRSSAKKLQSLTERLMEAFDALASHERNDSQVALILEWGNKVQDRLQEDMGIENTEEDVSIANIPVVQARMPGQFTEFSMKPLQQPIDPMKDHYISTVHVHTLAAAAGITLQTSNACTPILLAVDEFVCAAVDEAIAIAQIAERSSTTPTLVTVTAVVAALRLIMSADESSQMRPVGFAKPKGKSRGILEIWMSREVGGALMVGRAASSDVVQSWENEDSTKVPRQGDDKFVFGNNSGSETKENLTKKTAEETFVFGNNSGSETKDNLTTCKKTAKDLTEETFVFGNSSGSETKENVTKKTMKETFVFGYNKEEKEFSQKRQHFIFASENNDRKTATKDSSTIKELYGKSNHNSRSNSTTHDTCRSTLPHQSIDIHVVKTSAILPRILKKYQISFETGAIEPIAACINRLVLRCLLSCRELSEERGIASSTKYNVLSSDIATVIMVRGLTPTIPAPLCAFPPVKTAVRVESKSICQDLCLHGWYGSGIMQVDNLRKSPKILGSLLSSTNRLLAIPPVHVGSMSHKILGHSQTTKKWISSMGNSQTLKSLVIDIMKQRLSSQVKAGKIDPNDLAAAAELSLRRTAAAPPRATSETQSYRCEEIARVLNGANASDEVVLGWIVKLLQERFDAACKDKKDAEIEVVTSNLNTDIGNSESKQESKKQESKVQESSGAISLETMFLHLNLPIPIHFTSQQRNQLGYDAEDLFAALTQIPPQMVVPMPSIPSINRSSLVLAVAALQQKLTQPWIDSMRNVPCRQDSSLLRNLLSRNHTTWSKQEYLSLALSYLPPFGITLDNLVEQAFATANGVALTEVKSHLKNVLEAASRGNNPRVKRRFGKWMIAGGTVLPAFSALWKQWGLSRNYFVDAGIERALTKMVSVSAKEVAQEMGLNAEDLVVVAQVNSALISLCDEGLACYHVVDNNFLGMLPSTMKVKVPQVLEGVARNSGSKVNSNSSTIGTTEDMRKACYLLHASKVDGTKGRGDVDWAIQHFNEEFNNSDLKLIFTLIPAAISHHTNEHGDFCESEDLMNMFHVTDATLLHLILLHGHLASTNSDRADSAVVVTAKDIAALPCLLWPARLQHKVEPSDGTHQKLHLLTKAARNLISIVRSPIRAKPVRLKFKKSQSSRHTIQLAESLTATTTTTAPTASTASTASTAATAATATQKFQERTYQDDVIASKFPLSAVWNLYKTSEVDQHSEQIRFSEWVQLLSLVRSSLLMWRNCPDSSVGDFTIEGSQRSIPQGLSGCLEILLNAAGLHSRKLLSTTTVVRLQDVSKTKNIAERFLFSVFDITRVSRFKIPRSVFWTMLKNHLSNAKGKMTNSTTFVRAQAVHQTLERQLMSCVSLCARIAEAEREATGETMEGNHTMTTITGEQVRVVRTLLEKMSDEGFGKQEMPRMFDNEKNASNGFSSFSTSSTHLPRRFDESAAFAEEWDKQQWELPAFMMFAEERRFIFTASSTSATAGESQAGEVEQSNKTEKNVDTPMISLGTLSFAKITQRITSAWKGLSKEDRQQWRKKAYEAGKLLEKSLSPPVSSLLVSDKKEAKSAGSSSEWSGRAMTGETKYNKSSTASSVASTTQQPPTEKTKSTVLEAIYELEGSRPKTTKYMQPKSIARMVHGMMGLTVSGQRWCEECECYHNYDY